MLCFFWEAKSMVLCQQALKKSLHFNMKLFVQEPVGTQPQLIFLPPHHTQRCIFFHLKSTNPLHIKLAHPDSSAPLPTLSHKTPGEICLQVKTQRTVKRTLDSSFQMKDSTLLMLFLTYPPWTLPCSWDAQNCKAEFPFTLLCAGCCVGGKEHVLLNWENFPLSVSAW